MLVGGCLNERSLQIRLNKGSTDETFIDPEFPF
jgi:hypothetical protein